jgi:hypothetical protein
MSKAGPGDDGELFGVADLDRTGFGAKADHGIGLEDWVVVHAGSFTGSLQ